MILFQLLLLLPIVKLRRPITITRWDMNTKTNYIRRVSWLRQEFLTEHRRNPVTFLATLRLSYGYVQLQRAKSPKKEAD